MPCFCFSVLQFVMFYACALDPENCGVRFARLHADIFVCKDYPLPFRSYGHASIQKNKIVYWSVTYCFWKHSFVVLIVRVCGL